MIINVKQTQNSRAATNKRILKLRTKFSAQEVKTITRTHTICVLWPDREAYERFRFNMLSLLNTLPFNILISLENNHISIALAKLYSIYKYVYDVQTQQTSRSTRACRAMFRSLAYST